MNPRLALRVSTKAGQAQAFYSLDFKGRVPASLNWPYTPSANGAPAHLPPGAALISRPAASTPT